MKTKSENVRQLIDLALSAGRSRQSPQTGYIHYFYDTLDESVQDASPLLENFLFALVLLRTKSSDFMTEAKEMIEKLLYFQSSLEDSKGNFPVYIHQYPFCHDRLQGANLLPVFYWIWKTFQQVLGTQLKERFKAAITDLMEFTLKTHLEKPGPYRLAIKIAASAEAFGELWSNEEWKKYGQASMQKLKEQSNQENFIDLGCPKHMADILIALQMIYPSISDSPWGDFWTYISYTWHRPSSNFVGPVLKGSQFAEEPQSTLYDLFLGYFAQTYSYRAFINRAYLLHCALIQPTEDNLTDVFFPFSFDSSLCERKWHLEQHQNYAYCVIQQKPAAPSPSDNTSHPFYLSWGDYTCTHTFVMQCPCENQVDFEITPQGVDLIFTLNDKGLIDESNNREIAFYIDYHEGLEIFVGDKMSTTFQIGEKIRLNSPKFGASLSLKLEDGDGRFFGHIMRGNRPSQINLKGEGRFRSYDWMILLRTLRRSSSVRIRASIEIKESE